jgi:hypothetical protein
MLSQNCKSPVLRLCTSCCWQQYMTAATAYKSYNEAYTGLG